MRVITFLIAFLICSNVYASDAPKNLYKALLAEAVSDGYDSMYAVACVVRNRQAINMNHGLVAMRRKNLDEWIRKNTTAKNVEQAKEIVRLVFVEHSADTTLGATHYENIELYGTPYWAKTMTKTVQIGSHTFFK